MALRAGLKNDELALSAIEPVHSGIVLGQDKVSSKGRLFHSLDCLLSDLASVGALLRSTVLGFHPGDLGGPGVGLYRARSPAYSLRRLLARRAPQPTLSLGLPDIGASQLVYERQTLAHP
jgi:hypothetical protein